MIKTTNYIDPFAFMCGVNYAKQVVDEKLRYVIGDKLPSEIIDCMTENLNAWIEHDAIETIREGQE